MKFFAPALFSLAVAASSLGPHLAGTLEQRDGNSTSNSTADGRRSVLYVTNWGIYGAKYNPEDIPAQNISHVQYAFADIRDDGTVISSDQWADTQHPFGNDSQAGAGANETFGIVKQLYLKKLANRNLKVLLSVGGYTWSPKFAPVAADASKRATFVSSAVTLMGDWGMDGIDIDWEYPNTAETNANCVKLLSELRKGLDDYSAKNAPGYKFTLSFPAPAGPKNYAAFNFKAMDASLDFWSLMAFDFAGSWDNTTGHQANVFPDPNDALATKFSIDAAVADYVKGGVPSSKINLGLPMYGRAFSNTKGLGQPYQGLPEGSLSQQGIWMYKELPRPGSTVMYDDVAKASWSFDNATGLLVSYDDEQSVKYKAGYISEKGLGGSMFWDAAQDKGAGNGSIVAAMAGLLGKLETSQNLLSYPASKYANIRTNMGKGNGSSTT